MEHWKSPPLKLFNFMRKILDVGIKMGKGYMYFSKFFWYCVNKNAWRSVILIFTHLKPTELLICLWKVKVTFHMVTKKPQITTSERNHVGLILDQLAFT